MLWALACLNAALAVLAVILPSSKSPIRRPGRHASHHRPEPEASDEAAAVPVADLRTFLASVVLGSPRQAAEAMMAGAHHPDRYPAALVSVIARARVDTDPASFAALAALRAICAQFPELRARCWPDVSPSVRLAMVASIAVADATGSPTRLDELTRMLQEGLLDPDPGVRRAACRVVAVLGNERAFEMAAPLLRDADDEVHREACKLIGRLADRVAIPLLAEHLSQTDDARVPAALQALVVAGRRMPEPLVRLATGSGPAPLRIASLRAIGAVGLPATLEPIAPLLHDATRSVRRGAAEAIAAIAHRSPAALNVPAVTALITQLERETAASVTVALIEAIHACRDVRAAEPLRRKLPALNPAARERALEVLSGLMNADKPRQRAADVVSVPSQV
jgi:HEAT repeat protein